MDREKKIKLLVKFQLKTFSRSLYIMILNQRIYVYLILIGCFRVCHMSRSDWLGQVGFFPFTCVVRLVVQLRPPSIQKHKIGRLRLDRFFL